jgi:hypothetical protein
VTAELTEERIEQIRRSGHIDGLDELCDMALAHLAASGRSVSLKPGMLHAAKLMLTEADRADSAPRRDDDSAFLLGQPSSHDIEIMANTLRRTAEHFKKLAEDLP